MGEADAGRDDVTLAELQRVMGCFVRRHYPGADYAVLTIHRGRGIPDVMLPVSPGEGDASSRPVTRPEPS